MKGFPCSELLCWYQEVKRDLPWRNTQDPYRIWISEIILQQTRVDQGLPYYERFIEQFPDIEALAFAKEDQVLKLWEGLGYYSRARNLHYTAKYVSSELRGVFPETYKELLELKGVGPYTAAAIGSIAFGLPVAAVDGNVYRVLSRYFGIAESIDETATKKRISQLANDILTKDKSADHNQAVMELGATVCVPISPKCESCPLKVSCIAFANKLEDELPIRTKKIKVRDRFFYYAVTISNGYVLIKRRSEGDIWQGLYEFPLTESECRLTDYEIIAALELKKQDVIFSISEEFKHVLSHQRIFAKFVFVKIHNFDGCNFFKEKVDNLSNYAFPRLINRYLEKQNLVIDKEVLNI